MNRTTILVIALTGAAGLGIGWGIAGGRTAPRTPEQREIVNRRATIPLASDSSSGLGRHEFPLQAADIANDRETPALAVDANGRVALAWAAQSGDLERTLYVARSSDSGRTFDEPTALRKVPIYRYGSKGKAAMTYSTHVLPRLVTTTDGLFLGWVEAIEGGSNVVYYVARSGDGGKTFGEPITVHGADAKKPGFTMLTVTLDGALLAGWLDGRNQGQQPFLADKPGSASTFATERLVYEGPEQKGICPCCDIAAVRLPDHSDLVAFRNSDSGHRDIWFAQASAGKPFTSARPLAHDKWNFDGCPHDGPSLALDGDSVYAAWMSAHSGKNRVYVATSSIFPLSFESHEVSKTTAGAQGHPKVVVARPGTVYAVWDESLDPAAPTPKHSHGPNLSGSGRAIMLARLANFGSGDAVAVSPRDGAFQLNPAAAVAPDAAVLVAWSEIDSRGKRIVIVRHETTAESR